MRPLAAMVVALLVTAGVAVGQDEVAAADDGERAVERVLALRRELERLLSQLSPEERAEFERRWLEVEAALGEVPAVSEEPPAEVITAEPPAPEAPPTVSEEPPTAAAPPARRPRECNTLSALDNDGDGSITGSDRYWRHLYLWQDDGDEAIEKGEVERLYELRIRRVDADLRSYETAKDSVGDVWIDGGVRFDLFTRGKRSGSGLLTIDADGLLRGDDFRLLGPAGEVLRGMQRLRPGLVLEAADGTRYRPLC